MPITITTQERTKQLGKLCGAAEAQGGEETDSSGINRVVAEDPEALSS